MYRYLLALLLGCSTLLPVCAQSAQRTSLHGTVTDSTGAVIAGATIKATPSGNEAEFTTVTGQNGQFTLSNLVPGSYQVSAEQNGFNRVYQSVKLAADSSAELNFSLAINLVTQNVSVSTQTTNVTQEPVAQTITSVDR